MDNKNIVLIHNLNAESKFTKMVANFSGPVRHEIMAGRDHLVVPMVMMVEGVLDGSQGPGFYSKEEISKFPDAWNSRPVVVYHPNLNGRGISACDPDVISNQGIGTVMNARIEDGQLKAEAWCEVERMEAVDDRVAKAVENNKMMELSTGLFIEAEKVPGDFDGTHYDFIARNFRPDHLAVLPDIKGACSMEDGAGFIRNQEGGLTITGLSQEQQSYVSQKDNSLDFCHRFTKIIENEMSHGNLRSLLSSALRAEPGFEDIWIEDVFDSFLIYEKDGSLFKRDYTEVSGVVTLTGTAVEVVRITEFRTLDGKFVGNRKDEQMDKKKVVDGLIAHKSTNWKEEDRTALMAMNESVLAKMTPVGNEEETLASEASAEASTEASAEVSSEAIAESNSAESASVENASNMTVENYLETHVPLALRGVLTSALNAQKVTKTKLIAEIIANEKNTFTEAFLNTKDVEELQNMCNLAGGSKLAQVRVDLPRFNYGGQGGQIDNAVITGGVPLVTLNIVGPDPVQQS